MTGRKIIIAIDGHSSSGKSTLSKDLAVKLKYNYIDSGSMYRAVTLYAIRNNLINNGIVNKEDLISQLDRISISFKYNPADQKSDTILNGENVEREIRGLEVSNAVSPVATIKEVRAAMVKIQKQLGKERGIVMDGRDIGTVVYPEAELKLFVTTSPKIRAQRRFDELKAKGEQVTFEEVLKNVEERDYIDQNREESPLRKAADAIELNNGNMTREEQLEWVLTKVNLILNDH
ncbi:MAG TPA: (d)CMP kinase [Prolixibacteraceae bacterium]|nr:(d)CMP kinase [Prolixibacteraceae bacterium]